MHVDHLVNKALLRPIEPGVALSGELQGDCFHPVVVHHMTKPAVYGSGPRGLRSFIRRSTRSRLSPDNGLPVRLHPGLGKPTGRRRAKVTRRPADPRRYDGLDMTHETIVGTHCAMVPFAYQSGLQQVFSN